MRMSSLHRKLLRDLWQMRALAVAIAVVMACGVALFVLSRSLLHSLEITQQTYYDRHRFADVFASVKRAPLAVVERLAEIPGVAAVEPRIVAAVNLLLPRNPEPVAGRLVSVPDGRQPQLNRLYLRSGSLLSPRRDDQTLASEAFAQANGLQTGDYVSAVINGRLKRLRIVGIVLSPEYVYEIKPGDVVPDNRHFGVFWMNEEALATAYDLDGAFNDVTFQLLHGASTAETIARVDRLLDPYGGLGAYDRTDQASHQFVDNEIEQNRNMGLFAPSIFLGVSAFLLNVVFSRVVNGQREQIAALKAFGYADWEVGWHYLEAVLLIVAGALALGLPLGAVFGRRVTAMYAELFHFPEFSYRIPGSVLVSAAAVSGAAGVVGCLAAVARAARLPPAEAMRVEPPTGYGPTLLERLGLGRLVSPLFLMVARQLERHPVKTTLSTLAIALAAAVLVVGNFFEDAVDSMMAAQFDRVQRYDLAVTLADPLDDRAIRELAGLPGVLRAEGVRSASVRFRAGPRSRLGAIQGIDPDAQLFGLVDMSGRETPLPSDGLLLSAKLAEVLEVRPGDRVQVEFLQGKRPVRQILVAATVEDFAGLSATMNRQALHRVLQEGPVATGVNLLVDPLATAATCARLRELPKAAAINVKSYAVDSFRRTIAENMQLMKTINLMFACVIAVGVVYNSARVSLAERERELATLRVIGFTRGEISAILLGELATVTLMALPLGLVIGRGMAWLLIRQFNQELFRFPLVISRWTYAFAALVVLLASLVSGLVVRRRLDRLDLPAALKARE